MQLLASTMICVGVLVVLVLACPASLVRRRQQHSGSHPPRRAAKWVACQAKEGRRAAWVR